MRKSTGKGKPKTRATKTAKKYIAVQAKETRWSFFRILIFIISLPFCWVGDFITKKPKQAFLTFVFGGTSLAIITNALLFQNAPHPAPFFIPDDYGRRGTENARISSSFQNRSNERISSVPARNNETVPLKNVAMNSVEPAIREESESNSSWPSERESVLNKEISEEKNYIFSGEGAENTQSSQRNNIFHSSFNDNFPLPPQRSIPFINNLQQNQIERILTAGNETNSSNLSSYKDKVMKVQQALVLLGYGQLTVDGIMGSGTRSAIESFERDHGLPVTGELNDKTYKSLAKAMGKTTQM